MRDMKIHPTPAELRDAFNRAGLWQMGWTFERALQTPVLNASLANAAAAYRKKRERLQHLPTPEFRLT